MKISSLLVLVVVTWAKPQRQNCFLSQCNQNNVRGGGGGLGLGLFGSRGGFPVQRFPSFSPSLNIQNCRGSQCNQNNVGGGRGFAGGSFFGGGRAPSSGVERFPTFSPSLNIQNCGQAQCGQNNLRRKREVEESEEVLEDEHRIGRKTGGEVKNYVCSGTVVSSTCLNSHCRIICSDGLKYDADCGSLGTSMSSSPSRDGKTVVTVTCGGEPANFPPCFPFCSNQPAPTQSEECSASALRSCISGCGTSLYQACVTACITQCSHTRYSSPPLPVSPFPPCFPFCGPLLG